MTRFKWSRCLRWLPLALVLSVSAQAAGLPEAIERVTPSIVVIGTYKPLRQPPAEFRGTGFAVHDGRHVITNAHVLPETVQMGDNERLAVFIGQGDRVAARQTQVVARDQAHDLALLRIGGERLPALSLGASDGVRAGERFVFTGFPIGMVLGMYPVTHEALISSVTPIAIPQGRARDLDPAIIRQLEKPWQVYQLDATAYPGNSGSPLYDPDTATVVGVINMVFVKDTKENVLKDPSGIAYAIPIRYARALLDDALER